jgi:hypothetical protein
MSIGTDNKGTLRLTLLASGGGPLHGSVEIRLSNQTAKDERTISAQADKPIVITGLLTFPNGLYKLEVLPAGFQPQTRAVLIVPLIPTEICMIFQSTGDPPVVPVFTVGDTLTEADLTVRIRSALTGPNLTQPGEAIIWQDAGDEVLVHLSTLQIRLVPPAAFAAIDLESDQTGRGTLIVRFVFGKDPAGLFATTDEVVRGHPQLAARWGPIFRDLIWCALTRLSSDHAAERGLAPLQLSITSGNLQFHASKSLSLPDRVNQIVKPPLQGPGQPKGKKS